MRLFLSSQFREVKDKYAALNWGGKTVAFISTAAGIRPEMPEWMKTDFDALVALGYEVSNYDITGRSEDEIFEYLSKKDIIFVAGGNTFYLLYQTRLSGFDTVLARLKDSLIYIGSSAGSIIVGPSIEPTGSMDKKDAVPELTQYEGLGFVDFVVLPHANDTKYGPLGRQVKEEWKDTFDFIIISDEQAVVVTGDTHQVV